MVRTVGPCVCAYLHVMSLFGQWYYNEMAAMSNWFQSQVRFLWACIK